MVERACYLLSEFHPNKRRPVSEAIELGDVQVATLRRCSERLDPESWFREWPTHMMDHGPRGVACGNHQVIKLVEVMIAASSRVHDHERVRWDGLVRWLHDIGRRKRGLYCVAIE